MGKSYFTSTKPSNATLHLDVPADLGAQRIYTYVEATNDNAGQILEYFPSVLRRVSTGAAAAAQKVIPCTATAGIAATDIVIIQDAVDSTLIESDIVAAVAANVSYTITNNLVNSYSAGALIYLVDAGAATVPAWSYVIGAATVTKSNGTAVFVVEKNQALYLVFDGCTAICDIHSAGFLRTP